MKFYHMGGKEENVTFVRTIDRVTTEEKNKEALNTFKNDSVNARILMLKPEFRENQNGMVASPIKRADLITTALDENHPSRM